MIGKILVVGCVLLLLFVGIFMVNVDEENSVVEEDNFRYGLENNKLYVDDGNIRFEAEIRDGGENKILRSNR